MGQIVSDKAKPKRCNINKLSQLGTPAAGEHILVSSDNSMNAAGQGNFDCYIVGDGKTAATELELKKIKNSPYDNELPVVCLYGRFTSYSGIISATPSSSYAFITYTATENVIVQIDFFRSNNDSYNGRVFVVNDISDLDVGKSVTETYRFAQNVRGKYFVTLSAGQTVAVSRVAGNIVHFYEIVYSQEIEDTLYDEYLNGSLVNAIIHSDYTLEELSVASTTNNKELYGVGGAICSGCNKLEIYEVSAGSQIYIHTMRRSGATYQFQNTSSASSNTSTASQYLVGDMCKDAAINNIVEVPAGATHLLVVRDAEGDNDNFLVVKSNRGEKIIAMTGASNADAVTTGTFPVVGGKMYKLSILNWLSNETRNGYLKFGIDILNTTAGTSREYCLYRGKDYAPREFFIETESGEDLIQIKIRAAAGYVVYATCNEVKSIGVFDYNSYDENLIRLYNMQKAVKAGWKVPFTLLHFSDIHADSENMERITQYKKTFQMLIDDIIHTGDMVESKVNATSFDFWSSVPYSAEVLNVIGNHDIWYEDGFTHNANYPYVTYFKPYIDNNSWGTIVQPSNAEANNLCYYYKDYAAKKVRLIVLDYSKYDTNAVSWFTSALADAKTNEYHVIVAIHYTPTMKEEFNTGFNIGSDRYQPIGGGIAAAFTSAVENYIQDGGNFVCWLCGHQHRDYCGVAGTNTRQVVISIDCAKLDNGIDTRYRAKNTRSQDAFNMLSVNTNTRTIQVFRIGNDRDALQRHIGAMCIDYHAGTLLYTE